jgi:predicted TIM-barrel fold metal-dependent hydrolase
VSSAAPVVDIHSHASLSVTDMTPHIEHARRRGNDRMVLLGDVLGFGYSPPIEKVRLINDHTFDFVDHHPEFLYGFCFVNPLNDPRDTIEELERCRARGARGAKMEVSALASDHRLDPVMAHLRQVRLPLLHHSWNTFSMGRTSVPECYQTDPDDIAELAARFPDVTIIAAHLRPGGVRGVWAVRRHRNVLYDTSGGQPTSEVLEDAVRLLGAERVLYGSDVGFPAGGRDVAVARACVDDARITDRQRELILGGNALRLLEGAGR